MTTEIRRTSDLATLQTLPEGEELLSQNLGRPTGDKLRRVPRSALWSWLLSQSRPFGELDPAVAIADTDRLVVDQTGNPNNPPAEGARLSFSQVWSWIDARLFGWRVRSVAITAPTSVSFVAHHNRTLILTGAHTLTFAWASTGDGFACLIWNRHTADVAIAAGSGAVLADPVNTKIKAGGMASVQCIAHGGQNFVVLAGATGA
jgi:hypothetical protein